MAGSDYVVRLTGDSKGLNSALQSSKKALDELSKEDQKLDKIKERFDRIQNSTTPLKRKLRELTQLMGQMNVDGLNKTDVYSQMAQQAGEYADALGDARQAINAFADDQMNFKAASEALTLVASTTSIATGAMGLLGVENDKVQQAMLKVQSAIALVNGVTQVSTLLNKDSVIMLKVKQIMVAANTAATTKATVAEGANTVATVANTVAKKAWNVATAIGKALLGDFSGLVLVGAGALATYAIATTSSTEATEEQSKAVEKAKSIQSEYTEDVGAQAGQLVGKYQVLRGEWNKLTTEAQKIQWLKDNQSEMQTLGMKVEDVVSAENVFNKNTPKVIQALEARAKAMAATSLMIEAYKKYYSKMSLNQNTVAGGGYWATVKEGYSTKTVGQDPITEWMNWIGSKQGGWDKVDWNKYVKDQKWTAAGAASYNEYAAEKAHNRLAQNNAAAEAELAKNTKYLNEILEDANNTVKSLDIKEFKSSSSSSGSGSGRGKGGNNSKPKTPEEQRRELYDTLMKGVQTAKNDIANNLFDIDTIRKRLEEVNRSLTSNGFDGINVDAIIKEGQIKRIKDEYSDLATQFENGLIDHDTFKKSTEQFNSELKNLGANPIVIQTELEIKRDKLKELTSSIAEAQSDYDSGLIDEKEALKRVKEINDQIQKLGGKPIVLEIKTPLDNKREKLSEIQNQFSQLSSDFEKKLINTDTFNKGLEDINSQLEALGLEPYKITIEDDGTISTVQEHLTDLQNTLDGMGGSVSAAATQFKELADVLGDKEADAADKIGASLSVIGNGMAQLGADGAVAKIGATAAAIGQIILGFATASAQAAKLGPFGWLAFTGAGLGAVATMIAAIQSYAEGGIIEGGSYHGDRMIARVNAGEMILNQSQQSNLYRAIKNGNIGGGGINGNVEFVISGDKLKGVLRNHDNKMNKIK